MSHNLAAGILAVVVILTPAPLPPPSFSDNISVDKYQKINISFLQHYIALSLLFQMPF